MNKHASLTYVFMYGIECVADLHTVEINESLVDVVTVD